MRPMKPFNFLSPTSILEAVSLLNQYGDKAKVIAGGTDLVVLLKMRKLKPEYIVDITNVTEMDYIIEEKGGGLRLGALTTLRAVEKSQTILQKAPILVDAACQVGTMQVRNRGTVGGNLVNASPAADMATPLIALGATLKITGPNGERVIPAEEFFVDAGKSVLRSNELLTEVQVPAQESGSGGAFLKIGKRTTHTLSVVNVATVVTVDRDLCKNIRIVLGSVAPTPIRAQKAEAALVGKRLEDGVVGVAAEIASGETRPISDVRASAEYRKDVVKVLLKRAVREAVRRAGGMMR